MNSGLFVVMTHGAVDDVCRLFLPYWQKSGCQILFSSPYDDKSKLDDVFHLHTGRAMTKERSSWWFYQLRVLKTMKAVSELPFQSFVFTQFDSICLGEMFIEHDVMAHVFPNDDPNYKASFFVHPPWIFHKWALVRFLNIASSFDIQTTENGIMDRWLALVLEQSNIPVAQTNDWSWSANSIDTPALVQDCRNAIARGARFIHGVKNKLQLDQILAP